MIRPSSINYLFILFTFFVSAQNNSSQEVLIKDYIKLNLQSDIHYFLEFEKEKIPEPTFDFSKEQIVPNFKMFDVEPKYKENKEFCLKDGSDETSNYIIFSSKIIGGYIAVEVLFKREEYLNIPNKSEYEKWRRYNAGMSYLFHFSDSGCLSEIKKNPVSYD